MVEVEITCQVDYQDGSCKWVIVYMRLRFFAISLWLVLQGRGYRHGSYALNYFHASYESHKILVPPCDTLQQWSLATDQQYDMRCVLMAPKMFDFVAAHVFLSRKTASRTLFHRSWYGILSEQWQSDGFQVLWILCSGMPSLSGQSTTLRPSNSGDSTLPILNRRW